MMPSLPGVDELLGRVGDAAMTSVFDGIVSWMARGLAFLIEWIWATLDTATTPRLREPWFTTELLGPIGLLALSVVVALMLASAIQAALAGRPEQIADAFKQAAWSIVATALSITVMDTMLGVVDELSAGIWSHARADLQGLLEWVIAIMGASSMTQMGFLSVLMMLLMYLALIGLAIALAMRGALIYVTALMVPLVFASSVLPMFRESSRKIVHLAVALIFSKLAIVATLTLAVKMLGNAADLSPTGDPVDDGMSALGVLFAGVVCFAVASITPVVLYKLMPTVEGAVIGAGIAGGWGRQAMTGMYAANSARNLGSSVSKMASGGVPGSGGGSSPSGGPTGPGPGAGPGGGGAAGPGGPGGAAAGASGSAGSAASSGAGSGGAVALPVMAATTMVTAGRSAVDRTTGAASSTADAAQDGQRAPGSAATRPLPRFEGGR